MKKRFIIAVMAAMAFNTSVWAEEPTQPIQGKVTVWVNELATKKSASFNSKKLMNGLMGLLDVSGSLQTDQVALSAAEFVLNQQMPKTSILILKPKSENRVTEQFKGYLSAILLHEGYATGEITASDLPQSQIIPFAVYPHHNGVVVSITVNDFQMSRFYALQPTGKVEFASAMTIRKMGDF